MWKCWVLFLCVAGLSSAVSNLSGREFSNLTNNQSSITRQPERRFACPIGFFRLKRFCYYLSAGIAPWRDAYFHCKDRNATLAILDRNGKDKMLRKYLMGDQFTKLERWIGGIFNWQQMTWEWGVTGEKMVFQSFGKNKVGESEKYAWHCIIMDPALKYKWSARSCVERKHYICEVPAGRVVKRRRKSDPFAPQNQRLKHQKKGKKYGNNERSHQKKRNRENRRNRTNWSYEGENQQWAHGVKLGWRPPYNNTAMQARSRMRHRDRTRSQTSVPKVAQVLPQERQYGAFLGDGPNNHPNNFVDMNNVLSEFHNNINDFAREEVLLKP